MQAAYELFSRQGIQGVGIDAIIERSGVARQTMYRHFASKQDLVVAFLERRDELWTRGWLQAEVQRRASDPAEQLLAVFDVFDEWFRTPGFEGCSFINVMLEHPGSTMRCTVRPRRTCRGFATSSKTSLAARESWRPRASPANGTS